MRADYNPDFLAIQTEWSLIGRDRHERMLTIQSRNMTVLFVVLILMLSGCATQQSPIEAKSETETGQTADSSSEMSADELSSDPSPAPTEPATESRDPEVVEFAVPSGARPHDVAPAPDGTVWYTAQRQGALGRLDPETGDTVHIPLGSGSAPHGVIVGPDGAPWITDSGLNAIVRVDPDTQGVDVFPLPTSFPNANLNTAVFDNAGVLWFTGQNGVYGRLDPTEGVVQAFSAPRGRGPYGITATPDGVVYYASLAGNHIARIDPISHEATVIEPPTSGQGARRVWSDSSGRIWVSEWNAGQLGLYDPASGEWLEWRLPGSGPQAYAVYIDENDTVWLSDFGSNSMLSFDPDEEQFEIFPVPSSPANVRQILGIPGEVWGAESGTDKLVVIRLP